MTSTSTSRALPGHAVAVASLVLTLAACSGGGKGNPDGGPPDHLSALECLTSPDCQQPLIAAHRGYHRDQPENSLAALRAAADLGVDLVEVDVRETSDEVLVLMHDGSVDRTTDGQGDVSALTWAQIQALTLDGSDPGDPESSTVPRFSDALALADELGIMLYVDQKTTRADLVLAVVQAGGFHDAALIRDNFDVVAGMIAQDPDLWIMPPISSTIDFDYMLGQVPALPIVELAATEPSVEISEHVHASGVRLQQDVMAHGDILALVGDYTGWKDFIEVGVDILQTDLPDFLVPAEREYEQTGTFPDQGPLAL